MAKEQRKQARVEHPGGEEPIRFELFSIERLEQHAVSLAQAQKVSSSTEGHKLMPRVHENSRVLLEAYEAVARAVRNQHAITPAAQWLLDNFMLSKRRLLIFRLICPKAIIGSYPSWRKVSWRAIRACMVSRGQWLLIPTAILLPNY